MFVHRKYATYSEVVEMFVDLFHQTDEVKDFMEDLAFLAPRFNILKQQCSNTSNG